MALFRYLGRIALLIYHISSLTLLTLPRSTHVFDPERCARLHNRIVSLVSQGPLGESNDIVNFFVAHDMEAYRDYLTPSFTDFLSSINVARSKDSSSAFGFTPQLDMPYPTMLWSFYEWDADDEYPYAILLYPENSGNTEGGLFFDMSTNLCAWIQMPGRWPHPKQWYPLEAALEKYLAMFETGKFSISDSYPGSSMQPYVEADVAQALAQYDALLEAIIARSNAGQVYDAPLVSAETLSKWNVHGFAREFLSRARKPSFTYIAPGIKVFDDRAFDDLMTKDIAQGRQYILLFPSNLHVTEYHPLFASAFGSSLIDQLAGVYILQDDVYFGDNVEFVTPFIVGGNGHVRYGSVPREQLDPGSRRSWLEGNNVLYQHGNCPCLRSHQTRLVSLLQIWTANTEEGVFEVGPDGAEGGMEFYRLADTPEHDASFNVGACW